MKSLQSVIEKYGIPGRDEYSIPDSPLRFPDGAHYRMEISPIDSPAELEALVEEKNKYNVPIHRVICYGRGANVVPFNELKAMAELGKEEKMEMVVLPGPRANFDIGRHTYTEWGRYSGVRVRGSDNISYFLEDVHRSLEAGFRAFLFYGEDLLYLFSKLRKSGDLPGDLRFKVSYTQGISNAAGAKLLEELGADSINPITDLTLPMLASIRKAVGISLDLVTISFEILGNINRFNDAPEMVRVSAPCYLKQELQPNVENARMKVKYCDIMREIISRRDPSLILSEQGPDDLRVPQP